jgi:hypothetical protein
MDEIQHRHLLLADICHTCQTGSKNSFADLSSAGNFQAVEIGIDQRPHQTECGGRVVLSEA